MNELLPKENKDNFINRVFNKIRNLFFRNKKIKIKETHDNANESITKRKENELEGLKIDVKIDNTEFKKKEFMNEIINNPELLENFSTDRLEKILEYILEDNEKKRVALAELKQ